MVDEHVDADCIDRESFDASLRRDGSKLSLPRRAACQFDDLFWLLLTPNDTTGRLSTTHGRGPRALLTRRHGPTLESNCDIYLKPGTRNRDTQRSLGPTFCLARYSLRSSCPLNSRYLSRMQNYMDNDENKPLWEKNSRGFWLTVCLMLSAVAGWLMFHAGFLH